MSATHLRQKLTDEAEFVIDQYIARAKDIRPENTTNSINAQREIWTAIITILQQACAETHRQFVERQSEFDLLLPDGSEAVSTVAVAMAEWCEGFLHGLVSDVKGETLKKKLADEPLSDIIRDMLEMTRATAGNGGDVGEYQEGDDEALTELVEYLRVAAQLVYEELAELRRPVTPMSAQPESDAVH